MKIYLRLRLLSVVFILLVIGGSTSKATKNYLNYQKFDIKNEVLLQEKIKEDPKLIVSDTTFIKHEINRKLELARQHYVAALESFDSNDSIQAATEFEKAIKELDQLSYYPDIENNEEFNELSRSLIEDYEKLIIAIDILNPETPIFALREKINTEAERIDLKKAKIHIPKVIPVTEVELTINESVEKYINYFMEKGTIFMPSWFYRSGYYFPMMKKILIEEKLPPELIYLSVIESGLNPTIRSRANAVGLWQFMKSTGSLYGLKSNFWVDDRRDPEKSTRAAAKHMKDLYDNYQNWHLVMAAYNSGAGRVNSAIKRGRANDYWEITKNLPKETRGYVPQYIAISLIFMNPEEYGFYNLTYAKPYECDTIIVNDCYDLEVIAEVCNIDFEELQLMNPELVQSCTPPGMAYNLKVPKSKSAFIAKALKQIPAQQRNMFILHNVKKGETIASISKKYNITQLLLVDLNNLEKYRKKKARVPVGLTLKIPKKINTLFANNNSTENSSSNDNEDQTTISQEETKNKVHGYSNQSKLIYIAKKNDNLKTISEMFGVRTSDIRNWNDIPFGEEIKETDSVDIWLSKTDIAIYKKNNDARKLETTNNTSTLNNKTVINHKIMEGETLTAIAKKYNVTVNSIKQQNNLINNNISVGQTLTINSEYKPSTSTDSSPKQTNKQKDFSTYIVKKGDTLYTIAKTYGVKVDDVKNWNNLRNNNLKVGQKLKINS